MAHRGDPGKPSSRPAGNRTFVAASVKGARTLASLREGASAPLDCLRLPPGTRRLSGKKPAARPQRRAIRCEKGKERK